MEKWPLCDGTISIPLCLSPAFQRLPQSERVSQGLNGDLYFSNVLPEDAREDYICYARFNHTQTIQQKQPISVKVTSGKSSVSRNSVAVLFANIVMIKYY